MRCAPFGEFVNAYGLVIRQFLCMLLIFIHFNVFILLINNYE